MKSIFVLIAVLAGQSAVADKRVGAFAARVAPDGRLLQPDSPRHR